MRSWESPTLLPGHETLLKSPILGLPGLIDQQSAEQTCPRADSGAEPRVARNRTDCRTAAGADGRAGQGSLLGGSHIGASSRRQRERRNYQIPFHDVLRMHAISEMAGTDTAR